MTQRPLLRPYVTAPPAGSVCFLSTLLLHCLFEPWTETRRGPLGCCLRLVRSCAVRMGDKDPVVLHCWHIESSLGEVLPNEEWRGSRNLFTFDPFRWLKEPDYNLILTQFREGFYICSNRYWFIGFASCIGPSGIILLLVICSPLLLMCYQLTDRTNDAPKHGKIFNGWNLTFNIVDGLNSLSRLNTQYWVCPKFLIQLSLFVGKEQAEVLHT